MRIDPGARAVRCLGVVRSNVELRDKATSQDGRLHMPLKAFSVFGNA